LNDRATNDVAQDIDGRSEHVKEAVNRQDDSHAFQRQPNRLKDERHRNQTACRNSSSTYGGEICCDENEKLLRN